ncbi:MAG: hypothetical protein LAO19_22630 [Acidobacteriia bacterium]|nr:hypothetical protein [Terriglobia bacterium]
MNARKTIRILAVSFALLALLVFSTTVVSDWDCRTAADDVRCPYCHLSHQAPAPDLEIARVATALEPVGSLPLPEEVFLITGPVLSDTAPRAPPFA